MVSLSKIAASSDNSLPKWQIALIASVPIAVGLGYLYYRRNNDKVVVKENGISATKKTVKNLFKQKNDVQQNNEAQDLTPLEKAERLKEAGNSAFRVGDYETAIDFYTHAIEICPPNEKLMMATFYQNRAAAFEKLDRLNEVIEDCTKALDLNGRYVKAVVRRSKAYEKLNDLDKALEDLAFATFIETSSNTEILTDFERIGHILGDKFARNYLDEHVGQPSNLPSRHFVKTYLTTFTHGSAVDQLDADDEIDDRLLKMFQKAEKALMACKREEAELLVNTLIREARQVDHMLMEMEGLVLRGTLMTLTKRNIEALSDLTTVIENEDADPRVQINAYIKRATVYHHLAQPEKCFEDFYKAEQIDENNPDIYHHLGQIYLISERLSESVSSFRKATALYPEFAIFAVQHCFVEYKYSLIMGNTETADHFLNEFKGLVDKFPDNVECKTMYSQILAERLEYTAADNLFNEAIREQADHAALYVHKALMLLQWKGDIAEATRLIHEALKLDNSCEFAYETLATIEAQMGHFRTALDYYDQAIEYHSTIDELSNLCSTRVAVQAQLKAAERLGIYTGPRGAIFTNNNG